MNIPTSPTPTPIPACAPVDNPGLGLADALELGDGDEVDSLVDSAAGLGVLTPDCVVCGLPVETGELVEVGELEDDDDAESKLNVFYDKISRLVANLL